jgi:hypothetical protein
MRHHIETTDERSWPDFLPASALLFAGSISIAVAMLSPSPSLRQYAVIAPPWYDSAQTVRLVAAAGGNFVDLGGLGNIIIAHSEKPEFVQALYNAGAWLVVNPGSLRGCWGLDRKAAQVSETP